MSSLCAPIVIIINIHLFIINLDDMTASSFTLYELSIRLVNVSEKHLGYKILIVFNRVLVVMHPSSEIVRCMFNSALMSTLTECYPWSDETARERTDQPPHMLRLSK